MNEDPVSDSDSVADAGPPETDGAPELTPTQKRIRIFLAEAREEIQSRVGTFKVKVPGDEPFLWIIGSNGQRLWAQLSDSSADARLVVGDELAEE